MTKEQYYKLIPYDKDLINAVKINFVHLTLADFNKIYAVYEELFPDRLLRTGQMTCNTCRLNALKLIGKEYIAFKESFKPDTVELDTKTDETTVANKVISDADSNKVKGDDTVNTRIKPNGRPKKINLNN